MELVTCNEVTIIFLITLHTDNCVFSLVIVMITKLHFFGNGNFAISFIVTLHTIRHDTTQVIHIVKKFCKFIHVIDVKLYN